MSRSINDSVQLLTETLGNCKTALTEKQIADVDNIKISDVDEKIALIEAGGSGGFDWDNPKYMDYNPKSYDDLGIYSAMESAPLSKEITLSINYTDPEEDYVQVLIFGFNVQLRMTDTGSSFSDEWKEFLVLNNGKNINVEKKLEIKGLKSDMPFLFVIVFTGASDASIKDVLRIPVHLV